MKITKTILHTSGMSLSILMLVACGGGGGGSSSGSTTSSGTTTTTVTPTSDPACAEITSCVTIANGFQFPDGNGGTVTCTNGNCLDSNPSAQTSYNSGYNDGYNSGYNDGYSDGSSDGYNSGYNDGYGDGYNDGYNDGYSSGYSDGSSGDSVIGDSKDTDLQKATSQQLNLESRSAAIAQQFGMSADSARQLVQLSDQVRQMAVSGQLTSQDRLAVANSALKIAGVSSDEVNTAISSAMKGDMGQANDLMEKAAKNLGMASSADVRDKLIPSFGLVMP